MTTLPKRFVAVSFFITLFTGYFVSGAEAATLGNASDTISTSRPSASAPLAADQAASATQVTIIDNGSFYLASDSAVIRPDTGETQNTVTVATMSAASGGQRTVTFVGTAPANAHHAGDPLVVSVTAMHTVEFQTIQAVPVSGRIVLTFPALTSGDANNAASPSASTFQFNGLSDSEVSVLSGTTDISGNITAVVTNPTSGNGGVVTLTLDGATSIPAGTVVNVFLGCTAVNTSSCTTQAPRIINPTKSAAAGTADTWKLRIDTQNASSVNLDTADIRIATIETVQVAATVEPTLTFTIAGINNATTLNNGRVTGCPSSTPDVTNAGIASTTNYINLGVIHTGQINVAAQDMTVSTNAQSGYVLTATSSGKLLNPASGYFFASDTTGSTMTAGTEEFGIHACGTDANTGLFGSASVLSGTGNVAWPTATTPLTIASRNAAASSLVTTVSYHATVSGGTPTGSYYSVITYVVTPTF